MLILFLNFVIVTASIALFTAPFFTFYWLKHQRGLDKQHFNYYLENFFSSQQANWLVFAWAASEAVFWFVIPEFLLLLVIFMRIRQKRKMLVYDVTGTITGTLIAITMRLPESSISKLPYIQDKMITQTKLWYSDMGILGLANQPFSGVPYKVFTHLAGQYHFFLPWFIVVAVAIRMLRYLVAYGLFISLYPKLHRKVAQNYLPLAGIAILIFSMLLLKTYNIYK